MADQNPLSSSLANHTERELLIKILCELRVQTLLMAQDSGITDDIGTLRNDVMAAGKQAANEV